MEKQRVLIISTSAGTGHVRAAQALEKVFAADPRVERVVHEDALSTRIETGLGQRSPRQSYCAQLGLGGATAEGAMDETSYVLIRTSWCEHQDKDACFIGFVVIGGHCVAGPKNPMKPPLGVLRRENPSIGRTG